MSDTRYGVVWVYSDIRARMRTHRTSRRLTNRTDVTGPAATGIHPNCIRSPRDTASRLPRVDTLRRSSLPKFHDLASQVTVRRQHVVSWKPNTALCGGNHSDYISTMAQ